MFEIAYNRKSKSCQKNNIKHIAQHKS